jgi:N,N'-diacetyllegionaminate synthase
MKIIKINKYKINNNTKAFIIAEIGLSHDGSLGFAKNFIDRAKKNGAHAVKFQMHISEFESSKKELFRKKFSYQDKNRSDYWRRTSFNFREWLHLKKYCEKKDIIFLCSPFSVEAVKFLRKLGIEAWKIASGEFNNLLMLNEIIKDNKPIILSTGLTDEKEMEKILNFVKKKNEKIILLSCYSDYPTKLKDAEHNHISHFYKKFNINTGLSDHTGKIESLLSAIALGASVIETHVVVDRFFFGPDTSSSITFDELKLLSDFNQVFFEIKEYPIKKKILNNHQKKLRKIFNRSLSLIKDLKKNSILKYSDLIALKPGTGIPAYNYEKIIGKKLKKNIKQFSFLKKDDFY